jgi:hypothetical protein
MEPRGSQSVSAAGRPQGYGKIISKTSQRGMQSRRSESKSPVTLVASQNTDRGETLLKTQPKHKPFWLKINGSRRQWRRAHEHPWREQ